MKFTTIRFGLGWTDIVPEPECFFVILRATLVQNIYLI